MGANVLEMRLVAMVTCWPHDLTTWLHVHVGGGFSITDIVDSIGSGLLV